VNAVVKLAPQPPAQPTPQQLKARSLASQRQLAKAGMAVSLGVLTWSALRGGNRGLLRYHSLAGIALLGFVAWHLTLYKPRQRD
jgi:hypothetical protein